MGPLEAMVFLDASCYFWTRRGISARVHNERAAGRAGGRGKDGKTISGHASGRAGRLAKLFLDASCYFWTRRGISARVHNERAAGRAGGRGKDGKTISGHVFGRSGGRADRLPKLFLDTSSAKLFLGTSPGGRAGGRTSCSKLFLDTSPAKVFWARLRAGGRADRLAKLFLDASCYFWTRRGISARVHNERAAGRAGGRGREGWQNYFWTRLRAGGRADRLPKLFLDTSSAKLFLGTSPGGRAGGRGKATKIIAFCVAGARFWKLLV